jgi:hypothetical protein
MLGGCLITLTPPRPAQSHVVVRTCDGGVWRCVTMSAGARHAGSYEQKLCRVCQRYTGPCAHHPRMHRNASVSGHATHCHKPPQHHEHQKRRRSYACTVRRFARTAAPSR